MSFTFWKCVAREDAKYITAINTLPLQLWPRDRLRIARAAGVACAATLIWQPVLVLLLRGCDSQHMVREVRCWLVRSFLQRTCCNVLFYPSVSELCDYAQRFAILSHVYRVRSRGDTADLVA